MSKRKKNFTTTPVPRRMVQVVAWSTDSGDKVWHEINEVLALATWTEEDEDGNVLLESEFIVLHDGMSLMMRDIFSIGHNAHYVTFADWPEEQDEEQLKELISSLSKDAKRSCDRSKKVSN